MTTRLSWGSSAATSNPGTVRRCARDCLAGLPAQSVSPAMRFSASSRFRATPGSDTLFPALFEEFRDQPGPAGLMARAQPGTVLPVKVLIKQNQITPERIRIENIVRARERSASIFAAQKNPREPAGNFRRNFRTG